MKTIFFVLPNLVIGGSEKMVVQLADECAKAGHRVHLVTLTTASGKTLPLPPGLDVIKLEESRSLRAVPKLMGLILKHRPNLVFSSIIHMNILCGFISFFFPGIRFVARETLIPSEEYRKPLQRFLYAKACRMLYPRIHKVIFQSSFMQQNFEEFIGKSLSNGAVINNFLDVSRMETVESTQGMPGPYFIAVGRLNHVKRFHLLIDLIKITPSPTALLIIGEGELKEDLMSQIKSMKLEGRVKIIPFQPNHLAYVKGAKALLMSSQYEGFPNVALEALALGRPVIAYDCKGGLREILADQQLGRIIPPEDAPHFAEVISSIERLGFSEAYIKHQASTRYDRSTIIPKYFAELFA